MKLTILGGGGFRVPLVYRALSSGQHAGLISQVSLYDTDPARMAGIAAVLAAMPTTNAPVVTLHTSPAEALAGAQIVFAAIRQGGTDGRVLDERVALRHGVLGQETTGAGGLSYALRSIPTMLDYAQLIRAHCPDAWLINFSNPAGMVTQALTPVLGQRVIGICDSPIGLVRRASRAAGFPLRAGSLAGVRYVGLNHLGWLHGLSADGVEYLPALLADTAALASFEEGRLFGPDLLSTLGSIPNEYLYYYYAQRESFAAVGSAHQTRGESIAAAAQELYPALATAGSAAFGAWDAARLQREEGYLAEARTGGEERDAADLAGGGYEEVALSAMAALLGNADASAGCELILNVPNNGTVAALPDDAVIEVPCSIDGAGATPLPQAPPTLHQLGLMAAIKAAETAVVRAATYGDRSAALEAFALHPLVDSSAVGAALLADYEEAFPALRQLWR